MSDDILGDGARLLDTLNRAEFERARAKITTAPLTLTDHDFVVLHNHGDEGAAAKAYEARRAAQLALVTKSAETEKSAAADFSSAPAAVPSQKGSAVSFSSDELTWEQQVAKHGHKTMTFAAVAGMIDVVFDVLKNQKAKIDTLKAALDTLQQQNKALSDRVLELEAQRAAVTHAD